jgi:hypothetical protein
VSRRWSHVTCITIIDTIILNIHTKYTLTTPINDTYLKDGRGDEYECLENGAVEDAAVVVLVGLAVSYK